MTLTHINIEGHHPKPVELDKAVQVQPHYSKLFPT